MQASSQLAADALEAGLSGDKVRVVFGVSRAWSSALPHLHDLRNPRSTYLSPLWFHIVNSEDKKHLLSGTQVRALKTSGEAIDYATSYANKLDQKTVPESFSGVGRFWGSSRSLTDSIVELEDISIRQLQHIRTNYLESVGASGRTDRISELSVRVPCAASVLQC